MTPPPTDGAGQRSRHSTVVANVASRLSVAQVLATQTGVGPPPTRSRQKRVTLRLAERAQGHVRRLASPRKRRRLPSERQPAITRDAVQQSRPSATWRRRALPLWGRCLPESAAAGITGDASAVHYCPYFPYFLKSHERRFACLTTDPTSQAELRPRHVLKLPANLNPATISPADSVPYLAGACSSGI